jgi:hypothetical protein
MHSKQQSILERAVDLIRSLGQGRIKVFFGIGECLSALKGSGKVTVAITLLKRHIEDKAKDCGNDIPKSPDYYYAAYKAYAEFTPSERERLIAANVSWARVSQALKKPEHLTATHAFASGRTDEMPGFWQMKGRKLVAVRRYDGRSRGPSGTHDGLPPDTSAVVSIPITSEDDEAFETGVKSLVSQVSQARLLAAINKSVLELKTARDGQRLVPFRML